MTEWVKPAPVLVPVSGLGIRAGGVVVIGEGVGDAVHAGFGHGGTTAIA